MLRVVCVASSMSSTPQSTAGTLRRIASASRIDWKLAASSRKIATTAGFSGGKYFLPVQGALPHGNDFLSLRRPALHVHGNEAAGILREILGGIVAPADGGNLELELHQFGIQKAEQHVIGALDRKSTR